MAEKYQDEGLKGNEKIEKAIAKRGNTGAACPYAYRDTAPGAGRRAAYRGGRAVPDSDANECKGGKNLGRCSLVDRIYRL